MSVSAIGSSSSLLVQSLVGMRAQLDDLQRQLGTGRKSDTYAGVGLDRGLAVGLRAQLVAITGYQDSITTVGAPLQMAQTSLDRLNAINHSIRTATQFSPYDLDNTGHTTGQKSAGMQLEEVIELLNTQVGDRFLFSGRAFDQLATDTVAHILDGDGARAGFKQVMAERNLADLGASGLGRLLIPVPGGNVVSMSEDVAGSPFGFKLAGVNSGLTNATITGPAGSPAAVSVDFTAGDPNPGDTIKFSFTLPDGSIEELTLTATNSATPGPDEFTIGGAPGATALNFRTALANSVGKLARTALAAASAIAAGNDFFNIDAANPPRRVAGPPFDTATALVAGTPANTVTWYTGEAGPDPARSTALARVDSALAAPYGMRANEQAIRLTVQSIAVYASMSLSASDPDAALRYRAMANRVNNDLVDAPGKQKITDIAADLATAQATLGTAKDRHQQNKTVLTNLLSHIESAPAEEVGAKILALQTSLEASLQTTAALFRLSLVNFLQG
jgi:flagellin-like hook-associated protein FlgL